MGISGLLQFVREAAEAVTVKSYAGKRVAVDVSTWIHKGAYGCALELGENHESADSFVVYCMSRVYMLRANKIEPLLVFDGQKLPMKAMEHAARDEGQSCIFDFHLILAMSLIS